jgi:hypothetical protein
VAGDGVSMYFQPLYMYMYTYGMCKVYSVHFTVFYQFRVERGVGALYDIRLLVWLLIIKFEEDYLEKVFYSAHAPQPTCQIIVEKILCKFLCQVVDRQKHITRDQRHRNEMSSLKKKLPKNHVFGRI